MPDEPIILKGNQVTTDKRLDRLVQFDERSRNFPIRAALAQATKPKSYTWTCNLWLDQGKEGACTGFAVSHEAAGKPVKVTGITSELARTVYARAKQLDEWPGEDYEGSSVLGAIKAGVELGWYKEYRWAFGLDDLILAVGWHGPAVLGIPWYTGMFQTDASGYVHATGTLAGGHAILCHGVNVRLKLFKLHNSWGQGWGMNGECYVSFDDMAKLLAEQGEACVPVVRLAGKVVSI